MSSQLRPDDALAVMATQEEPTQPQPAPVAPAAEEPPPRRPGPFLRVHRAVKEVEPWSIGKRPMETAAARNEGALIRRRQQ
jgi:hypothetical protein